jgi:uncharacterized protein (DUF2141 family)
MATRYFMAALCLALAAGCSCRSAGEDADAGAVPPKPAPATTEVQTEGGLRVRVLGVRDASGMILVSAFGSAEGFPGDYDRAAAVCRSQPSKGTVVAQFESLPPGRYAVAVLHDENGNDAVDTGLFGIPKEGIGVSNNPEPGIGPPAFSEAAFDYDGTAATIDVSLRYISP